MLQTVQAVTTSKTQALLANAVVSQDQYGHAVFIDGDTAMVGAYLDDEKGPDAGACTCFVRNNNNQWIETDKIHAMDAAAFAQFGVSVSLDGDSALIGAFADSGNGSFSGAAYVFTRDNNGTWTQQAKLQPEDGESFDVFGRSVALQGDTALISSGDNNNGIAAGAAYLFNRDLNGQWAQSVKLIASDAEALDTFGSAVALDGDRALIGASGDDDNGNDAGAAYIFERDAGNGVWSETQKLHPLDSTAGQYFGDAVALQADTALIGAWGDATHGTDSGAAYIFYIRHD